MTRSQVQVLNRPPYFSEKVVFRRKKALLVKRPTDVIFGFLSVIFLLLFLDMLFIHPFGEVAAILALLLAFYQIGRQGA